MKIEIRCKQCKKTEEIDEDNAGKFCECKTPEKFVRILGNDGKKHWLGYSSFMSNKRSKRIKEEDGVYVFNAFEEKKIEVLEKIMAEEMDKRALVKRVLEKQPFYYDEAKIWWFWNDNLKCWKMTDETNILNSIGELSTANTVSSREKAEILEAMRQEARKKKPKEIKKTWIQFKEEIFDLKTGIEFLATPEYFATNPISYGLDKNKFIETPTMDKMFEEWVGEKKVKLLYEIIAYCMLPDYPIHRLFCCVGEGLNGKTKFFELLTKFIGRDNVCSTDLDLILSSRFERIRLYKKLACIMGETNFNQLNKTSTLKRLTGQDLMGFEKKHKNPFDDYNYAKILIATNTLPETADKSVGFYRRWEIIDFPREFSEKKDILATIPEEEYEALALKCCNILSDLIKKRAFHGEVSVQERAKRYEEKSNPIIKFIEENCKTKDENAFVWSWEFGERYNAWCSEYKHRPLSSKSIGVSLKHMGYVSGKQPVGNEGKYHRCWSGLSWKKG